MSWDLNETVEYYRKLGAPGDQSALTGLLGEVQENFGGRIPKHILAPIADALGTKESYLLAVIKRMPRLHLADSHCLELCAGPNCSRRAALAEFVEKNYGAHPAKFSLKYVPCMRLCGKGPNIRWDGTVYHQADEALLRRLIGKPEEK